MWLEDLIGPVTHLLRDALSAESVPRTLEEVTPAYPPDEALHAARHGLLTPMAKFVVRETGATWSFMFPWPDHEVFLMPGNDGVAKRYVWRPACWEYTGSKGTDYVVVDYKQYLLQTIAWVVRSAQGKGRRKYGHIPHARGHTDAFTPSEHWLTSMGALIAQGYLVPFGPRNALDAVSSLTALERYSLGELPRAVKGEPHVAGSTHKPRAHWSTARVRRVDAAARQNAPWMRGRICPFESPESPRIGISLHLARGAQIDNNGAIVPTAEQEGLGFAAACVPFAQHNDGARITMGAKNLKQALPGERGTAPSIYVRGEEATTARLRTLAEAGHVPTPEQQPSFYHPGCDLLVAYMPWLGWNMDDAIAANTRIASLPELTTVDYREFTRFVAPGWEPGADNKTVTLQPPLPTTVVNCFEDGLLRAGTPVEKDTPIALFIRDDTMYAIYAEAEGTLRDIAFEPGQTPLLAGCLRWKVGASSQLAPGDKMMGRHGNKGVIARFFEPDDMPRLPEDPRLGELSGSPIDLVLNPHGVISRMNLGQLLETQAGLLHKLGRQLPADFGTPYGTVDIPYLRSAFQHLNRTELPPLFDTFGRLQLTLPGGKLTAAPVCVGFQRFVRLDHAPAKKASAFGSMNPKASRNPVTGQPRRGKRARTQPQRMGEMEMWAMAAYAVPGLMRHVLGERSGHDSPGAPSPTYCAIRDHFDAMGLAIRRSGPGQHLTQFVWRDMHSPPDGLPLEHLDDVFQREVRGVFGCRRCDYIIPELVLRSAGAPTLGDLMRHYLLEFAPRERWDEEQETIHVPLHSGSGAGDDSWPPLHVTLRSSGSKRTLSAAFSLAAHGFLAVSRTQKDFAEITASLEDWLMRLPLRCPVHSSPNLALEPRSKLFQRAVPIEGGLADPGVAYVRLPSPMANPTWPKGAPETDYVPVLAPRYRPGLTPQLAPLGSRILRYEALSKAYAELRRNPTKENFASLHAELKRRMAGKTGLTRRDGLGRRVALSARAVIVPDPELGWAEAGVAVRILLQLLWAPEQPEFRNVLDEARFALAAVAPQGSSEDGDYYAAVGDRLHLANTEPLSAPWENALRALVEPLQEYLRRGPGAPYCALLSRQPSLHRYSLQAFDIRVLPPERGLIFAVSPLVCGGFNADFDGDTMAFHLLRGREEVEAAECMRPNHRHNHFSLANGKPMVTFDQDTVAGAWLASQSASGRDRFLKAIADGGPELPGPEGEHWNKQRLQEWSRRLLCEYPERAAQAFQHALRVTLLESTQAGLSFSFLELHSAPDSTAHVEEWRKNIEQEHLHDGVNELLNERASTLVRDLAEQHPSLPSTTLGIMARSGARGKTDQIRQILVARGFLNPGHPMHVRPEHLINTSLAKGLSPEEAFFASMNSRSSLGDKKLSTPLAGSLTRLLVLALWPWYITRQDCGKEGRSVLRECRLPSMQRAVCAKCYGSIAGYKDDELVGLPVGLIAAQSIGERGTQLSMQSFHTGTRAISIGEVLTELRTGKRNSQTSYGTMAFESFYEDFSSSPAYKDVDKRHFEMLWLGLCHFHPEHRAQGLNSVIADEPDPLSRIVAGHVVRNIQRLVDESSPHTAGPAGSLLLSRAYVPGEPENLDHDG